MRMRIFTMNKLAEAIANEPEYKIPHRDPKKTVFTAIGKDLFRRERQFSFAGFNV